MVRHPQPLPSNRNRNRVTFKTRLRIFVGDHQADASSVDEDEEKTRLQQSVLGVDQEDANEHHLQQVLSAAAAANAAGTGSSTSASTSAPAAFIPTPDCTGVVDHYDKLYPAHRYKDPASFVCSSRTVEESCNGALAHGICYYMDEKDKEWVDRISEEARGEGTSAQAAFATPRAASRGIKAKGKQVESCPPIQMSEDEFELVMGLFELITHEETEYLHHSLKSGMTFPEFSNYQDVFANPLSPNLFALFEVPVWIPQPHQLLRMARLVYPYWKERRMERGGHRVIPTLNGDETDILNESYVCFRHREVKAVRKTRASQANPSEKLMTLQKQLAEPLELARKLLKREDLKRNALDQTLNVWKLRVELMNLKRANPSLGTKADEELLMDKEKPPAKRADTRIRVSHHSHHKRDSASVTPSVRLEPSIRPSHRIAIVATEIETALHRNKEVDQDWENIVDSPYVAPSLPVASRLFKFVQPLGAPSWPKSSSQPEQSSSSDSEETAWPVVERKPQAVRLRVGRGGRMMVDRRTAYSSTVPNFRARVRVQDDSSDDAETQQRLAERWRFDADDAPLVAPEGSEEQDRMLVDDYDVKHMRHSIRLLADLDPAMITDPSIIRQTPDGKKEVVVPFKFGVVNPPNVVPAARTSAQQPATAVATQQRISAAAMNGLRKASSFRQSASTPLPAPTTTTNASGRAAMHMPHIDSVKMEGIQDSILSHAQLKTAFATVERASGEMAKYIPPALRPPHGQWSGAPAVPMAEPPLRKPTPTTVNSSAATQSY